MNKQDEEKIKEVCQCNYCQYSHLCDSCEKMRIAKEMSAWKEQQMIEKMINWLALHAELYGSFNGGKLNEMAIAMKKEMEEN